MRFLIRLKLIALIGLWSVLCVVLYAVVALAEAVLEIGFGAAGSIVGQGTPAVGLADLTGDIIQWSIGLVWLAGTAILWLIRSRLKSASAQAPAAPPVLPVPKTASRVAGPVRSGPKLDTRRILDAMIARRGQKL